MFCGPHPDLPPSEQSPRFRGQRGGVATAAPAGWPWKAPGHEPARLEHTLARLCRLLCLKYCLARITVVFMLKSLNGFCALQK